MRVVFMGTPEFAVPCLKQILEDGYEVAGVFTQPDKPKGRGYTLTPPPVKELALQYNLPVYQPATLRTGEAYEILKEIKDKRPWQKESPLLSQTLEYIDRRTGGNLPAGHS